MNNRTKQEFTNLIDGLKGYVLRQFLPAVSWADTLASQDRVGIAQVSHLRHRKQRVLKMLTVRRRLPSR